MPQLESLFHQKLAGNVNYDSIATLADEPAGLTCSVNAARMWNSTNVSTRQYEIFGYPTFETAVSTVLDGTHDAALVAGAYPDIKSFFFEPGLEAVESQIIRLPDFVIAFPDKPTENVRTVYHHAATESLLKLCRVNFREHATAPTNSAVARLAKGDMNSAAVTNELCARHYGLKVAKVLAKGKPQTFTIFTRGE